MKRERQCTCAPWGLLRAGPTPSNHRVYAHDCNTANRHTSRIAQAGHTGDGKETWEHFLVYASEECVLPITQPKIVQSNIEQPKTAQPKTVQPQQSACKCFCKAMRAAEAENTHTQEQNRPP
eukprot:scaffold11017_cov20-Tisochrysis_lutea.AAC.1